jgi:hypothetical protein
MPCALETGKSVAGSDAVRLSAAPSITRHTRNVSSPRDQFSRCPVSAGLDMLSKSMNRMVRILKLRRLFDITYGHGSESAMSSPWCAERSYVLSFIGS